MILVGNNTQLFVKKGMTMRMYGFMHDTIRRIFFALGWKTRTPMPGEVVYWPPHIEAVVVGGIEYIFATLYRHY